MMTAAMSSATYPAFESSYASSTSSPGTFHRKAAALVPRTGDECDALLKRARAKLGMPNGSAFARELVRFLGAGSSVWTAERREELQTLIIAARESAIEPILNLVASTPRVEVTDDAELVLGSIAQTSVAVTARLLTHLRLASSATVRAVLLRSLSQVRSGLVRQHAEVALDDAAAEVRDAAATTLSQLGMREAVRALKRRLSREKHAVVLQAIAAAIEDLGV